VIVLAMILPVCYTHPRSWVMRVMVRWRQMKMEMMGPHLHSHTERKQRGKCSTPPQLHQAAAASWISFREFPQISVFRQPKALTSHVSLLNLQVITTCSFQELLTMHSPLTTLNNYSLRHTAHKLKLNNCQLSIDHK
jgi:hypothetical protein